MKKDTGCGLQVAGGRGLWAAVFVIILLVGISFSGSGQGLKYSFKEGEVLDYELIEKQTDDQTDSFLAPSVYKYSFTVISA